MDSETKLWALGWFLLAMTACVVAMCVAAYNINVTNRIASSIASGADPIKAKCAFDAGGSLDCNLLTK